MSANSDLDSDYPADSAPLPPLPDPPPSSGLIDSAAHQRRGLRWLIGSGVVLSLALGGWWAYTSRFQAAPAAVAVMVMPVERGSLEDTTTESGIVELGGQQTFKAPSDVTVQAVLVRERQRVAPGTVLLLLRDRQIQQALDDQLVENRKGELELTRKREIVAERQEKLRLAETRMKDSQALVQRGYISEDAFRKDKEGVDDALSSFKDAQVEMMKADLTVQNNQIKTQNLRTQLADNQIASPIEAVVLKVEVKPGDGVQREGRLLTIGDPRRETVSLQLTTLNASKIKANLPVRVSLIGPNPKQFSGRVTRISPQAIAPSSDDSSKAQSKVDAEAILDRPSGALIPGSTVSVEIILAQRQKVLTLPLNAIHTDRGAAYVWVKDPAGRAERRAVTVGLQNLQSAEITGGLREGEPVVVEVSPEATLTPGTPLTDLAPGPTPAGSEPPS